MTRGGDGGDTRAVCRSVSEGGMEGCGCGGGGGGSGGDGGDTRAVCRSCLLYTSDAADER